MRDVWKLMVIEWFKSNQKLDMRICNMYDRLYWGQWLLKVRMATKKGNTEKEHAYMVSKTMVQNLEVRLNI